MSENTQINVSTTTEIVNVDVTETLQPVSLECFFANGSAQDTVVNVSENIQNIELNVTETQAQNVEIEFFYPVGPPGPQGPPGTGGGGSSLWGTISGTLSAQTDLWRYLSAVGTSNFDITTLNNYLSTNTITLCSTNTRGRILSAGVDLLDIFKTTDFGAQTLSYIPSSYLLSISNGNTVNLSSINSTFAANSGKYETAYNIGTVYQSASGSFLTSAILSSTSITLSTVTLNPVATLSGTNFITNRVLQDKLGEIISVKDFGARGDGVTNDWRAIQRALSAAAGIAKVYIPSGLYFISEELRIPSNSYIYGAGIGTTIIKLSSTANATQCVMTNSQNTRSVATNQGNENIVIKDLELDGNVSRFPGSYSPVGDTSGTGLCLSNVRNSLIERVSVHDTCRHCFDICAPETSITFNPLDYTPNPSFNIHLKDIIAYGAGDDNITTHFSHSIIIENAYVPYTGGTEVPTNSNGIEIDDGSYDITIIGGYIKNCRRGLEVKGHSWAPAAKRIKVYGLTVENCVRNFGIRHLGFDATDSKTAFDVALYDCTSIAPVSSIFTADTPRSLQISNYDGVFIKDFKVVGEHNASRAVTIQERARNVNFDGVTFTQISGSITGITDAILYIDSTTSRNIAIRNAIFRDCIGLPIAAIGSIPGIIIDGVDARTSLSANPPARVIDFSWSPLDTPYIIRNVTMSGYLSAYQLGGSHDFDYPTAIDIGRITNIIPSSPATANTQYTVARFGWREGTGQALNAGLGTRIEFTGSVISGVSANTDLPIAYIGTRKVNGSDTDVTSNLTFGTLSANNATAVDRLTITSTGNVGINTTTPNERLTVSGNISSTGTISANVYLSGGINLFNLYSSYTDTTLNSVSSQLVTNTTFNNYQTSVAASTATLLPTSIYRDASGNWQSAYNTATVYQTNSGSYATNSFVNTNFLNLSGGIVSGPVRINNNLTVFGNLTATGTTTFANTVFSVTSSLSVVHIGSGPALYVGNNGDGDIASFYDIDQGIEILHVGGNNGTFPNVGVKTSQPNKDFTVKGEISASSTIYDGVGNSNLWNQAYSTITTASSYGILTSNITTDLSVGGISAAQVLPQGTTLQQFVEALFVKVFFPTFTLPSINVTSSIGTNVEAGTTGLTLNMSFLSGSINGLTVGGIWNPSVFQNTRSGVVTAYNAFGTSYPSTASTFPATSSTAVIRDGSNLFQVLASHTQGPQPKDSKNNNFSTPLPPGTVNNSITVNGSRRTFWNADTLTYVPSSSDQVRSLINSSLGLSNGSVFDITVPIGTRRVYFAYPSTLRNVTSVVDPFNNIVYTDNFTLTTVSVSGASSYLPINYKVYTYLPAESFPATITLRVTI